MPMPRPSAFHPTQYALPLCADCPARGPGFRLGAPHYLCFFTSKGSLHHYPGLLPTIGSFPCMIVAAQPAGSAPAGIASLMEPATINYAHMLRIQQLPDVARLEKAILVPRLVCQLGAVEVAACAHTRLDKDLPTWEWHVGGPGKTIIHERWLPSLLLDSRRIFFAQHLL